MISVRSLTLCGLIIIRPTSNKPASKLVLAFHHVCDVPDCTVLQPAMGCLRHLTWFLPETKLRFAGAGGAGEQG